MCFFTRKESIINDCGKSYSYGIVNNSSLIFGLSFSLFLIVMILRTSFFSHMLKLDNGPFFRVIIMGCILLLILKEYVVKKHSIRFVVQLIFIFLIVCLVKKNNSFIAAVSLFYIYSSRNEDFKYVAKIALIITSILLAFIICSSLVGIIPNFGFEISSERPRYFLGFRYALYAPAYLFNIVALVLFLKKRKVCFIIILLESISCYGLYKKTDSRLSFVFTVILIIISIIIKFPVERIGNNKVYLFSLAKWIKRMCLSLVFIICAILSIFVTLNYDEKDSNQRKLNNILTNRLYYGQKSYDTYGVLPFGQRIEWVGNGVDSNGESSTEEYLYVDNLYFQFLQQYGVILFVFVIILITSGMRALIKQREWLLVIIMILIAGHAMVDDLVLHIWYNTFWLAMAPVLSNGWGAPKQANKYIDMNMKYM